MACRGVTFGNLEVCLQHNQDWHLRPCDISHGLWRMCGWEGQETLLESFKALTELREDQRYKEEALSKIMGVV